MKKFTATEIRDLIASGKLDREIEALLETTKQADEPELYNQAIQLSARHKSTRKGELSGTISRENLQIEQAKISQSLLALVDEFSGAGMGIPRRSLEPGKTQIPEVERASSEPGKNKPSKLTLSKIGLIVGIVAGVLAILGYSLKDLIGGEGNKASFSQTINVHGPGGKLDYILENEGELLVDIGGNRRPSKIGEKGSTVLTEIPGKYHGKAVPVSIKTKGYTAVYPDSLYVLGKGPVYLAIKSNCNSCRIYGTVRNQEQFLQGIKVAIPGLNLSTLTDENGFFDLKIPPKSEKEEYSVSFLSDGKIVAEKDVTPDPNTPLVVLIE